VFEGGATGNHAGSHRCDERAKRGKRKGKRNIIKVEEGERGEKIYARELAGRPLAASGVCCCCPLSLANF
jgi:hypothetical protein